MFRALFLAFVGLGLVLGGASAQPPKGKDPPKDQKKDQQKDKEKEKTKEAPKVKEVVGMFKSKDVSKKTVTITVDGKDRTFKVADSTKIVGPRGGESDDRLKDDRIDKGYKLTIVPDAKEEDVAAEIRLPFRNEREGGDSKKDKK